MESPPPPKSLYGQCKCCLKNTYLRNMWEAHKHKGEPEVYGQMLVDCFSINWTIVSMEEDNMCQVCITKLKVANDFKKQVLESQSATLEAVQVEEEPDENAVLESILVRNDDHPATEEFSIPVKKDLITVPLKKVINITSLKEESITPSEDHVEKSSDEVTHENLERVYEDLLFQKSENDSTSADVELNEDVEFLEEDCLEEYGDDDDDDEGIEPNKKKRRCTRNLQIRNQRKSYRNYLPEDMEKALEAVRSGQMSKRVAAEMFNVPKDSIIIRSTVEKHEGDTDLEIPAQIEQHNGNDEVEQEVIEKQDQNEAKYAEKRNPHLQNGASSDITGSEKIYIPESAVGNDFVKCNTQNDTEEVKSETLLLNDVTSTIIEKNQQGVSEIMLAHENKKHVAENTVQTISILENDSEENVLEIRESGIENNLGSEDVQHTMYAENPESDIQQEITLETQQLDPQNDTATEDMTNYVLMQIQEPTQNVPVIPNNVSCEDILKMHKANIISIMAASNATPIRGHWGFGFACYYCSEKFADPSDLKKHTYTHDNLLAIKVKSVSDHVIKLDVTALKCNICDSKMDSLENLMEHLKNVHVLAIHMEIPNQILSFDFSSDVLKCVKCFGQFQTFKDLSDHMGDVHYRNYVCMQCDQGFVNSRSLKTHSIKHGISIFICSYCPDYFYSKEDIAEHENAAHSIKTQEKGLSKAQENQAQIVRVAKENIKNDKQNFAIINVNVEKERKLDRSKNLVNEVKNKVIFEMLNKKVEKEWNISVNETNLQHQCNICLKMFKSVAALSFHTNLSHQHKCHVCKAVFDVKFELQRHMRKVHPSRIFDCPKCPQKYSSQKLLEDHMEKHEYSCELCTAKFTVENSYMTHMKLNHGLE